jgi:hypothetical protein
MSEAKAQFVHESSILLKVRFVVHSRARYVGVVLIGPAFDDVHWPWGMLAVACEDLLGERQPCTR